MPVRTVARDFRRDRRGTTAVEFAIVAMIYVFMLLFAIDGGIFYNGTTVTPFANATSIFLRPSRAT